MCMMDFSSRKMSNFNTTIGRDITSDWSVYKALQSGCLRELRLS